MDTKDSIENYETITTLGRGSFGEVILARNKQTNQQVAIKILDKSFLAKEKKQYQVYIEKQVLQLVHHPGLINMYSNFQNQDKLYFVLEFSEGGDLANFLKINKSLSAKNIQFFTAQIVSIIEALHSHGVAHRDMKPENILLTKELHLKMIDFGTAFFFNESLLTPEQSTRIKELKEISKKDDRVHLDEIAQYQARHKATFVGTAEYVSPELLEDEICGPQADIWALGCIIYKMFTGVTPFTDSTEYLVFQKVKTCKFEKPNTIPPDALSLIEALLVRDPNARLGSGPPGSNTSFQKLQQHPFFNGIDFQNIWKQPGPKDVKLNITIKARSNSDDFDDLDKAPKMQRTATSIQKSEVVLTGLVNKKTGWMIYKPRNMILYSYETPTLKYFDPETGTQKGQIVLKDDVKIELAKGQFNIDVPSKKKYFFKECEHPAMLWVQKIKELMQQSKAGK